MTFALDDGWEFVLDKINNAHSLVIVGPQHWLSYQTVCHNFKPQKLLKVLGCVGNIQSS